MPKQAHNNRRRCQCRNCAGRRWISNALERFQAVLASLLNARPRTWEGWSGVASLLILAFVEGRRW